MDCLKDNIKSDLMQGIKSAVKRENEIFIPFTDSKGRNKTYGLAQSKIKQINKAYNSKVFGEAVSLNTSYSDGIGINIHVPKALRNAYDYRMKKAESEKLKQESRQQALKQILDDAKRAGIEYDEDYLFNAAETTGITVGALAKASYFKDSDTRKSSEVLLEISKSNHPLNKLAEKLLPYVKANDVNISLSDKTYKFTKSDGTESRAAGVYYPIDNKIELFTNEKFNAFEKLILHEVLHSISHWQLRQSTDANEDLYKLYEYAKQNAPKSYELETIDEFLVGIFTDSKFIKELQKLPAIETKKYKNYLEEFLDHLFKYLGFKKGTSLYEQAFDIATNILEDQKNYLEYEQYNRQLLETEPVEPVFAPSEDTSFEPKEGVSELFESNPALGNAVYEALGFNQMITPNDRIVFGHPTIGKSFLKNQGENKFISLDDDYATEINNKVKEIANKYNVTTYQVKDGGTQSWNNEYNQMMQEMFNVAKQKAISENKTLFTSNTNLLRNNAEFFDKVINLTDKEFERRIQERGAKYDTKEWKSQINEAISKLPTNKIINTDKYLSDLFITPQQKQQAQQLYSSYLDTIFPDSKVKDIVYHTTFQKFVGDKFNKPSEESLGKGADDGIYFSKDPNYYTKKGNKIASILDLKNPIKYTHDIFMTAIDASGYRQVKGFDGFITFNKELAAEIEAIKPQFPDIDPDDFNQEELKIIEDKYNKELNEWKELANKETLVFATVFEPEQIHILGSQQDIEGFKKFTESKSFEPKEKLDEVNYNLKSTNILLSDKANEVFKKGEKNKWPLEKILTELQIPKEQKKLILDLEFDTYYDELSLQENIAMELMNKYTYTVKINTAKEDKKQWGQDFSNDQPFNKEEFILNNSTYIIKYDDDNFYGYFKNNIKITKDEFDAAQKEAFKQYKADKTSFKPTNYYANLTVPGGTNYIENEIATPGITPSIKGHAQFATDKGIGWFRSDDKVISPKDSISEMSDEELQDLANQAQMSVTELITAAKYRPNATTDFKTRRILEVQSDLFQKGRDRTLLIDSPIQRSENTEFGENRYIDQEENGNYVIVTNYIDRQEISQEFETIEKAQEELNKLTNKKGTEVQSSPQNQFLQLLNKDNNWVNFFIKSIIQDSAKKGYEKVLFPSGNTASKIEGHTTSEEFKRQKEDRIKELEKRKNKIVSGEYEKEINKKLNNFKSEYNRTLKLKEDGKLYDNFIITNFPDKIFEQEQLLRDIPSDLININNEINQVKQELERVETEGFGALKPIYNFYENVVTNILKKQGYNPVVITDEYGNTWNEVTIDEQRDLKEQISFDPKEESDVDEFVDDEFNFDDLASEYAASQEQKTQEGLGIDTDTTLDDEVITNFDKVLSYKKSLVSKIKDRIANVQAIIKDTTDKEEALSFARKENQLQERLEQLENDIADTESGYSYGKLKFQAQQDLQRLQTLLESENVNDINEAKRIINFYKAMSFDAKKVTLDNDPITSHPIFFEEEIFDENGKMQLPQQTIDFFGNLSKAFASYEAQLEQKQKRALENIINSHPTIKQLYSENLTYKHLTAPTGDISWVDMMIMDPSKTISANNLIPQIMMDITQRVFAEKISKAKQFEEKHNKALVKAEKALTGMGKALTVLGFSNPSFDIFFQKSMGRNTGRLVHRYNQEFFDSRANMQADFKEQLRLIRTSGLDEKAKNKLLKQAYQERQQWFRENVIVFDVRRLREVREAFPDLADTYFDEVDDAHRKELIDNLGSEQAYKEEVEKQIRQIKKYFIWKESNREMVFEENGVETFEELSEDAKADLLFNEAVKSPFTGTDYFYYGDVQIGNKFVNTSMEYNISIPRRYKPTSVKQDKSGRYIAKGQEESTGYYDKQFEQIEKNKDLYEYYKIVQEQMSTILNSFPTEVQEKLFTNSLPTVQKTFREILADPNISLYKKLYNALVDFYDRIRGGFGIKPQSSISFDNEDVITGKTEPTINAEFLNNNKSKINDLLDMELIKANNLLKAAGSKLKVKKNGTLDLYKLPQNIIKLISEKTNLPPTYDAIKAKYGERVPVGKILENSVMADIIQDSSTDLPKIIRYYNMMAAEYTARQQLLPYMEMMKNHYTQIQKPKTNKQGVGVTNVFSQAGQTEGVRTRANTQMEDWFNRVILGNRDVKAFGVIDSENVDPKTVKERIGNLISGRILDKKDRELNKKLNEMINNTKDQNEIDKLLKIKAGLGKQFAASAAFENLFNYIRYLGLGYNLSSGITNYMEGQIANMIIAATGDHFESHHYYRALNIVKGSLFKSITGNTNLSTQGSRKLRVLVDRYNILQDSTNELQKASVKTSLDVLDKFNPMEINKRTEYLNQTPLMISVMLSTEITGHNKNQKSNVWDALDMNGKLLPEFRTEENIKAWELGEGEMFTSFKTKTSQAIGMAHGMGYDNLRGMYAKSSTMGKALMMFKTWVGSQLYTRFASERDDAELGVKGYKGRYRSHTKASLSIMGGIVGWGFAATTGLGVGALAGLGVGALIGKRTGVKSNLGTLREYAFLGKAIARKLIGMPVNFIGSSFTGKQVMNEFVGYEKLIKEGKLGEGKFTERDAKNMKALVTEMSLQIAWIALALIAKGMLWDDDDEEDSPERIAHNLIVNRSLQVLSSSNMYVTPDVFTQIVGEQGTARFFTDVVKFVAAAQEWTEGNDIITRGINAGDSRTANTFYKIALPSAVRDSYFGFASQMERQFEKTSYDDWFFDDTKKANKLLESKRAAYKQELINEHGFDEEKDKKKITKLLNKRFPLLKDIKDPESKK